MIKTVTLTGSEVCVSNLTGQNAIVKNLGSSTVYASVSAGVTRGADGVAEIPSGGGEVLFGANGTVYLTGTGKVQVTGADYAAPNFKQPSSGASGGGVYSTDETLAGSAWIDGKPIYRKTLQFTVGKGEKVRIPINDIDYDTMINYYAVVKQPTGNVVKLSFYLSSSDYCMIYIDHDKYITATCGSTYGHGDIIVTLEYTKTTD